MVIEFVEECISLGNKKGGETKAFTLIESLESQKKYQRDENQGDSQSYLVPTGAV